MTIFYMSIIMLNEIGLKLQLKDRDWQSGLKGAINYMLSTVNSLQT